jgi:hypothetical protein
MRSRLNRVPQRKGSFRAGEPLSGYYNDLTPEVRAASPAAAAERLASLVRDPHANYTTVAQLGLGTWQLGLADPAWYTVTTRAARWLAGRLDDDGRLVVRWRMPHTFTVEPPWISALMQAEAVSLFLRASFVGEPLLAEAAAAARPLVEGSPILVETAQGPVLQEYPTSPPSHVLNGWIYGLFGLYDLATLGASTEELRGPSVAAAGDAFRRGAAAVAARAHLYDAWGWSRYDLYPHRIVHVASPYYHRLHIELLRALDDLAPDVRLTTVADRWEASAARLPTRAVALSRKVGFRLLNPRRFGRRRQSDSS